ncbi:nuclear receptor corepressor 1 [Halyomorpha halys]|uniref:nuclear receptor corepressor 1 n=1 Tax=Halyomorpha halys TaxID=286706 RepID=UPI0006D4D586|nr:nuclear receptor corepressor 1 [Halyomorpha halys]XP_014272359.1 nuclear receptor corepressor 1 [Halyomorpha halys]XP_014272360.1 nuclear receptor corepressor 1 [Halyomorpha halys]
MHSKRVEGPPTSCSQDTSDVLRNSNLITESTHALNLIRKHQRPRISPLLPNPTYLPAFYQNKHHNSYVTRKGKPQKRFKSVKHIIVQQFYWRKHQNVSYPQLVDWKSSTIPPHKTLHSFDLYFTKTNILQNITKVDSKIAEIESELVKRRKIEVEKKPSVEQLKQVSKSVNYSLFKKVIAENQQKAYEAHSIMLNLGPKLDFPLYNQPCDTSVYHENKKHYILFKEKLMMFLRKKCVERVETQKSMLRLYSHLTCKWKNNVNEVENSRRHKSKQTKNRNYFETVFPELQNKKLTKERFKRTGNHVISEADYQGILHRLQIENAEYTLQKSSSAHPPLLLDSEQRGKFFHNCNNLMAGVKLTGEKDFLNLWTSPEKALFKEKFIQYSKDFGRVASFLDKKSIGDCIQYYYLTKKKENYKISDKSKKMEHICLQQSCVVNEKLQLLPASNISKEK